MIERIGHLNRKVSPPKGQPRRKANIASNSGIHGGSVSLEGNSGGHPQGTAVTLVVRLHYHQKTRRKEVHLLCLKVSSSKGRLSSFNEEVAVL